jgi:hypothetical protein
MATVFLKDMAKAIKDGTIGKYMVAVDKAIPKWQVVAKEDIKLMVVDMIERGQSPVKGGGGQTGGAVRYIDYSDMYKAQIESARKNTGKNRKSDYNDKFKKSAFTQSGQRSVKSGVTGSRRKQGSYLSVLFANGKRLRPVNLKVTGEMLRSIKSRIIKNGIAVWFTDEKAKYHNTLGAGKSKVIRRMLPSESGEQFSKVIESNMYQLLDDIMNNELKK